MGTHPMKNFINCIFVHWCRAPSLASFAESISSIEEESEDNLWRILPEQREYYTKQFRRLQPIEGGVVKGNPQTEVTEQLRLFNSYHDFSPVGQFMIERKYFYLAGNLFTPFILL